MPVEKLDNPVALAAVIQTKVAGITQAGAGPFAVLHGKFVLAPQELALHMLRGNGPATVGIGALGLVQITEAQLQLTARVGVETGDVEVVTGDVVFLVEVVLARQGVAVLEAADQHVLDTGTGRTLVPVVEVGNMDVVTLVVTTPGPQRTAVEARQIGPLRIQLRQACRTVVTLKRQLAIVLVVQRGHAIDAQHRAIVEAVDVLAQFQLGVLFALVAQPVLGLGTGQLEAGLLAAVERVAHATAQVPGKLQGVDRKWRQQAQAGDTNAVVE